MRARRDNQDSDGLPGQDSFLDIVANIVGILILLVVVVGVRASRHVVDREGHKSRAGGDSITAVTHEQVDQAYERALFARSEVGDLVQRVVNVRRETLQRDDERVQLNTYVAAFQRELEKRRSELDVSNQRDFDLRRKLNDAQRTLEELTREQVSLLSDAPEVEELTNLPTPLATTVSGEEVHLRLKDGHVAFIPLEDLIAQFKEDAERNAWRLQDRPSFVATVGPVSGFRLRYRLRKSRFARTGPGGASQEGTLVQLVRWELLPVSPKLGEPVQQAIRSDSDLMHYLKGYRPQSTVITVWTYPGSFAEFGKLKSRLYELGFGTAGRPLPEGILIGGSPAGTKSAAQ